MLDETSLSGPDGQTLTLRWIFRYNRDDCLATWAVAQWLLEAEQPPQP